MAVVLPAPAGAIASCSRARRWPSRGPGGLPGVEGGPVGGRSSSASSTGSEVATVPVGDAGGGDEAPLGGEDPRARCTGRRRRRCRRWSRRPGAAARGSCDAVARSGSSADRRGGAGPRRRPGPRRVLDVLGRQVRRRGPGVAPRRGRARPARSTRCACTIARTRCRRCRATQRGVAPRRWRRAAGRRTAPRPPSRPTPRRAAEHLLGLARARWRAARPGCGVRAWRRGSPGWPAGPAAAPPPRSAAGRGRAGTAAASSAAAGVDAGPPGGPALVQVAGSTPTISRTGRLPRSVPGRSAKRSAEPGRAGASPGRCCRSRRRRRWP